VLDDWDFLSNQGAAIQLYTLVSQNCGGATDSGGESAQKLQ